MLPATLGYEALFGVAVVLEVAGGTVKISSAALFAGSAAVCLSWSGSWFMNDLYDKESDTASDQDRATVEGQVSDRQTVFAAVILWGFSLSYAALLSFVALTAAVCMIVLNVVYSVPPLRLKASGIGSMGSIGLMGATAVMLGSGTVVSVPSGAVWRFAAIVTVFMMLNLSYKDLKDVEEDAATGVENFVVSYGTDRVRWFLVVSLPISYLLGAFVIGVTIWPVLVIIGVVSLCAAGLLVTHDISTARLTHRLDIVNAIYMTTLASTYYAIYA
ncbi:bacteriochlorophyll/chlorophyll a synthase [Haloarcula amylolytica JCM 13557]|uniref:Bacteriochlorophyll/chlorophyll a synthase n=2 Tax=Haloarcula amylolytica TaxID=396317 RepID=M0K583_9EURY|nr:bacteriochlorophyll/chlorophyll a synthase [Haloarcula amylolytica JCM 13557]